ncbi:MAG: hypothetical protein ACOCG6_05375 [Candidatus Cloacimonadaceae bacterium]
MKILIIDDKESSVTALIRELKKSNYKYQYIDFPSDLMESISEHSPDALVLDLKASGDITGTDSSKFEGHDVFKNIWEHKFIPVLIYSAFADESNKIPHPFIGYIKKGRGSDVSAREWLDERREHIEGISSEVKNISSVMNDMIKSIYEYVGEDIVDLDAETLKHLYRRRIAAIIDESTPKTKPPVSSIYITPPISDYLRLADILFDKTNEKYYLVLTPSCDLGAPNQSPKVTEVLVAHCKPYCDVKDDLQMSKTKRSNILKKIKGWIIDEYFVLPFLGKKLPILFANLKQVTSINIKDIYNDQYEIIASIDSPFREKIAWEFVKQVGRTGLPEVCFEQLADDILSQGKDN